MKIITMYELLGMIKDGKAPDKIKFDNMIWEFDGDYYKSESGFVLEEYCNLTTSLNYEIEILEEEKKIPEKINEDIDYIDFNIKLFPTTSSTKFNYKEKVIINKINEIIDYLKSKGDE
jgi:hypothetical protein